MARVTTEKGGFGRLFSCLGGIALAASQVHAQPAPEGASGWSAKPVVEARRYLVVAADERATRAAAAVLERGGNAMDAAVAAQAVLNVVEPQSSGIGGGGFLIHYSARERRVRSYDGRETAPLAATPSLFLDAAGRPLSYPAAVIGGRSVGAPGLVAMLEIAHKRHGRLAWSELFEPAIQLALEGFSVGPRLAALLARDRWFAQDREARALFYSVDGKALPAGSMVRNAALAGALREIASEGSGTFYRGASAQAIVDTVRSHPTNPGGLTLSDLAAYRAIEREPLCAPYKRWRICSMGPPSSGGLAVIQILALLAERPMARTDPRGVMSAHLFAEASRLAYADRDYFVADPGFVAVPVRELIAPAYMASRAALIDARRAMGRALPGAIGGREAPAAAALEFDSTTHFSIVDAAGDVVSLTSSIESQFGARIMARGMILNNQLTDFSFTPERGGERVANRVEPGKRPRSSMAPVIVFDERGEPVIAIGSPGGPWIIDYVAWALLGVLEQGLTLQQALDRPHVTNRNGRTEIEGGPHAERLRAGLELLGHEVRVMSLTSGLHGFARARRPDGTPVWVSGVDPRREGAAAGR